MQKPIKRENVTEVFLDYDIIFMHSNVQSAICKLFLLKYIYILLTCNRHQNTAAELW